MPELVPYHLVSPGFEGVYTGEKRPSPSEDTDPDGNVIERWSVWTWLTDATQWDDEIRCINAMQENLGQLDEPTRSIRAQIGSLVLCDNGVPVTIDELLNAIGTGRLPESSFHNGCWPGPPGRKTRGTQPGQIDSMKVIRDVLVAYLAGETEGPLVERFAHAAAFIRRTFEWLGPVANLTDVQRLMMKRMLLPFGYFTGEDPRRQDYDWDEFVEGGGGPELDDAISQAVGLPKIHASYKREFWDTLETIEDEDKRELYVICAHIKLGVAGLSDCHHNTFRNIEKWVHGIGSGRWEIPTRKPGTERERLGRLLVGYMAGIDRWLMGKPLAFVLLDLGHVDLGLDPRNEILRVYAYLGEERTPVKEWLAACLWHNLAYHPLEGNPAGLFLRHKELAQRATEAGVSLREWMDMRLRDAGHVAP